MAEYPASKLELSLSELRENYRRGVLDEASIGSDPIAQFETWFREARQAGLPEPNAMTLATSTSEGHCSARIVLLKELDENGFVFYTNYDSRKGRDLTENPQASLVFYWAELERQVRIEGGVERVPRQQSEAYFKTRPRGSRLGAWVSHQSEVIQSRKVLEVRLRDLEARYTGTDEVPMPDYWGGFRVRPASIEFWQGRPNRLHDRLQYTRNSEENEWRIERLAP
jgi:pyridoxamine 5'-phosphate oxidase